MNSPPIPYAHPFYGVLTEHGPHPHPYQSDLQECRGAAIEHLDTARAALDRMREIDHQPLVAIPMDGYPPTVGIMLAYTDTHKQFSRTVRIFANESRACLESLVYEMAFAFQATPIKNGAPDERAIGFYNVKTEQALRKRAAMRGSVHLQALNAHFQHALSDPLYVDLDALRRICYHRNLPPLTGSVPFTFTMDRRVGPESATMTLHEGAPTHFQRPVNFEQPGMTRAEVVHESYVDSCNRTLIWLTAVMDEAYRLAMLALQEGAARNS